MYICVKQKNMNYRLLLSEMLIDYSERANTEENKDKKEIYKEVIRDLKLALEIEPKEISLIQQTNHILNK